MNWNDNNKGPWGSNGQGNNPWSGGGPSNKDFEETFNKDKERFGRFKLGKPKNLSIIILIALLIWLATGFYRVEPDEQGIELLFGKWNQSTTTPGLHYFFPTPIGKIIRYNKMGDNTGSKEGIIISLIAAFVSKSTSLP